MSAATLDPSHRPYISRIDIQNFRCLKHFEIAPEPDLNLVLGENNVGKSTLLDALNRALGWERPEFGVEDFHCDDPALGGHPSAPIVIGLEIRPVGSEGAPASSGPITPPKFSDSFLSDFADEIVSETPPGGQHLKFRTIATFDEETEQVEVTFATVRLDGAPLSLTARRRARLRSFLPFYLIGASRDAATDLRQRRSFWGRLVDSVRLDTATTAKVRTDLISVNKQVFAGAPRLAEVAARVLEVGRVLPLSSAGDGVVLNPVTLDTAGLLNNAELILRPLTAPRGFALDRHGEGLRSVASLTLFKAFIDLVAVGEGRNPEASPIVGIEEPEAHLHPQARRRLIELLADPRHQQFMTTHSGAVMGRTPPSKLFVMRRLGTEIGARRLGHDRAGYSDPHRMDGRQLEQFQRLLDSGDTDLLFASGVIVSEGYTERLCLPILSRALGFDLDQTSITLVCVQGQNWRPILNALRPVSLSIPWVVIADGENLALTAAKNALVDGGYVERAAVRAAEAAGRLSEDIFVPNDVFCYPGGQWFESLLISSGLEAEYERAVSNWAGPSAVDDYVTQRDHLEPGYSTRPRTAHLIDAMKKGTPSDFKPLIGREVVNDFTKGGSDPSRIPSCLMAGLLRARQLSTGAAKKQGWP